MKKKWISLSLLLLFIVTAALLFIFPIYNISRRDWPKIADEQQFISECILLSSSVRGQIDKSLWPKEIKKLNPVAVYSGDGYLEIIISSGGINPSWGYWIDTTPDNDTNRPFGLVKTSNDRVYELARKN